MHQASPSPSEGLTVLAGGSELQGQERQETYLVQELAAELRVSKHTIYRAIAAGVLAALRVQTGRGTRGTLRIPVDAALEYKARSAAGAATKPVIAIA